MAYGTTKVDTIQSSTANTPVQFQDGNGTQIGTLCRAWVNFNGTGTVAIRASFNVSSITDRGTGQYTINLTNALPDANGAAFQGDGSNNEAFQSKVLITTASTVTLDVYDGGYYDSANLYVAVFR